MEIMNALMKEKIQSCLKISISQNKKTLINKRVRKMLRLIKCVDGCLLISSETINVKYWLEKLTDYTGVEAYFNEFRVQDKLYSKADFSEILYFVLLFEEKLYELYPNLLIETILTEDNLGYYNYRFYQYREKEGHYSFNVENCDYPKRINQLWLN